MDLCHTLPSKEYDYHIQGTVPLSYFSCLKTLHWTSLILRSLFGCFFYNCLPPHFQKRHDKFAQPTRSLLTLKSNFWPISPLKLQCKTSKWRQEPIYGSMTLKIVLWAYLTYPHIWLKEHEEKSFFGLTYYTGLTQKHCLNSVTPSYKKCPASPSGQFPTLPLSFPHSAL